MAKIEIDETDLLTILQENNTQGALQAIGFENMSRAFYEMGKTFTVQLERQEQSRKDHDRICSDLKRIETAVKEIGTDIVKSVESSVAAITIPNPKVIPLSTKWKWITILVLGAMVLQIVARFFGFDLDIEHLKGLFP